MDTALNLKRQNYWSSWSLSFGRGKADLECVYFQNHIENHTLTLSKCYFILLVSGKKKHYPLREKNLYVYLLNYHGCIMNLISLKLQNENSISFDFWLKIMFR